MNIFLSRKSLLCLLLLLLSCFTNTVYADAEGVTWSTVWNGSGEAASGVCADKASQLSTDDQYGWYRCVQNSENSYSVQRSYSNPCTSEETWSNESASCESPPSEYCQSKENTTTSLTFSPTGFVSCKGACSVTQVSDAFCTGTAEEGGHCSAIFKFTGEDCPDYGSDPDSSPSSSPSKVEKESQSSSSNPDGSTTTDDTKKTSSTEPDGTKTDTQTDTSTTTNPDGSSTSTSTTSSTTTNPDGSTTSSSTTTTTTCDAEGNCSTSATGGSSATNATGDEDGEEGGSVSGGTDCESAYQCDDDPVLCAQLHEQWLARCNALDYEGEFADLQSNNPESGVGEDGSLNAMNPTDTDISSVLDTSFLGSNSDILSSSGSCPADRSISLSRGGSVTFSYSPLCDLATGLRAIIIAVATFSCSLILYRGVTS